MTTPLDLEWARRCAADFADKPTEARARNAAQCLAGLLDAYDSAIERLTEGRLLLPPEICREVHTDPHGAEFQCFLAHRHDGDHSTNVRHREPATWPQDHAPPAPCPGFPQARPEDARLACFKPAGHPGEHSNAPEWLKVGIDPCPARSWDQKTCLKGYLHTGAHEWGGTKTIVAGPELPRGPRTWEQLYGGPPQPCQGCPNQACPHPAMAHDIESFDEPRPMCTVEPCGCGRPAPSAQI